LFQESTVIGYYEMGEWIDAFSDDDDVVEVSFKHSVESLNKVGKNSQKRRKVVLPNKVKSGDCDKTLWLSKYKPKTCAEVCSNMSTVRRSYDILHVPLTSIRNVTTLCDL